MIRVYTYVVGDLLHVGHLRCLQQAKALGDYLVVGVLTDKAVEAYKRTPIIPFKERAELIKALDCVDEVVKQDDVNPIHTILSLNYMPDILTHGDDWGEDFPGAVEFREIGGQTIRTKYYLKQSTTQIIEEIVQRYSR